MIYRIVRMTLRHDAVEPFLSLYDEVSGLIRERPGCRGLVLYRDIRWPAIVTTHSTWETEDDLEAYRASDLFRSTWARTRPLFAAPAEAWSHTVLRGDPAVRTTG